MTTCRRCTPLGFCVCRDYLELQDAPAPLDALDDLPDYVPTRRPTG